MTKIKTYWKGLAELNQKPLVEKLKQNEFVEEIPVDDFFYLIRIYHHLQLLEETF